MRIWVLSDLHLDVGSRPLVLSRAPEADVAVVAGDVRAGLAGAVEWVARTIRPHMPTVMVAGNHEHYGSVLEEEIAAGAKAAAREGVELLEDRTVEVAGLRFSGCTLWTDYALDGDRDLAMAAAARGLNDHRMILSARSADGLRRFTPEAAQQRHASSRLFLTQTLLRTHSNASRQVVVTHHAPHRRSIEPRFEGSPLNAAFASDLEDLIAAAQPALWVHGHTHASLDYRVRATRVVCNPKGYGSENPAFDPSLVIEVMP